MQNIIELIKVPIFLQRRPEFGCIAHRAGWDWRVIYTLSAPLLSSASFWKMSISQRREQRSRKSGWQCNVFLNSTVDVQKELKLLPCTFHQHHRPLWESASWIQMFALWDQVCSWICLPFYVHVFNFKWTSLFTGRNQNINALLFLTLAVLE